MVLEIEGEILGLRIEDGVEFHADVINYGIVTTYSELLDSPLHSWKIVNTYYDKESNISHVEVEDYE